MLCSVTLHAQEWRDGLSELQQSRAYPYVEKSFALKRQRHFAAAAVELEKALQVLPAHAPLLDMLFDAQLAVPDPASALVTYQRLPESLREDKLLRIAQTQLDIQQPLALAEYSGLLATLSVAEQHQLLGLITQHLIANQRMQQAFNWLQDKTELPDSLLLQRAELADQLSLPQQVIADTESVSELQLTGRDWLRYSLALLQQGKQGQAIQLAKQRSTEEWASSFFRQLLQSQLSANDWAGAEQTFKWLVQHTSLTPAEHLQRYQSALNNKNTALAKRLIVDLQLNCLDKVAMYLQAEAGDEARAQFETCPVQQRAEWLTYADRWLSADALEAITIHDATLAKRQAEMVLQKRIAANDYQTLLKRKFSQPLRQQDYNLLITSINALTDTTTQRMYLEALYQVMPDDYLLDQLSFLYIETQQSLQALKLLEDALPFSTEAMARGVLPERLLNLLQQQNIEQIATVLQKLEGWSILTAERAELWRIAGRCKQAEQLLTPAPQDASGWKTLALCANNQQPAAAIQFWQQAYQLQPDPTYLQQIAYQYQSMKQPAQALEYLQQLPAKLLLPADWLSMAELALQIGDSVTAADYLQQVQTQLPVERARQHAIQAALFQQLNQPSQAFQNWQDAATLQPQNAEYQLAYAYVLAENEPEKALEVMTSIQKAGHKFDATGSAQLAYLNKRLGNSDATQYWTGSALLQYQQQDFVSNSELNNQFSLLRLQQQLQSSWRFSSSVNLTSGAITGERLVASNAELARNGMALKAEYFLDPLQQDLSLYAIVASNGNDSPWQNLGQQYGVSYKPVSNLNLWLSAGIEQYPLAEGDWHSLLRINADLLNTTPWQAEWRPSQQRWWERKLYIDTVWWPDSGSRLAQLRYDQGRVWKLNTLTAQAIKWYGLAQFDYRRQALETGRPVSGNQLSTGMGLQWRFWPGQLPVLLEKQRFEVNAEWQYQLAGDLNQRQHALLLQFYLAW
ncbi:NfrA family protein [Arsukibacterium tuosuense]|nr:hypothetical protein [Arsukibacterium tuosuense]